MCPQAQFSVFPAIMKLVFCLLGLAGVSGQEEGQQGVSRGDDIFGNGKHQDALPVYCLWKVNLLFCTYLLLFLIKPHSELFVPFVVSCQFHLLSPGSLFPDTSPANDTQPCPTACPAGGKQEALCAGGAWGWVPEGTGQHQRVSAVCQWTWY